MRTRISRRRFLGVAGAGVAATAMASCASPEPDTKVAEIRFQDRPPLRLKASVVDVVNEAPPAPTEMNWANVFPTMPSVAMRNWGEDRLVAAGTPPGIARYCVTSALITHTIGEQASGLFAEGRRETFRIDVAAVLDVRRDAGGASRSVSATAWGEESIPVDEDPWQRRFFINGLVKRVMADFDRQMEGAIRANMADLLI
jgi:hypothetical protein